MKKAFTLAEVLITLMIIGIVAALTIPSVISNYQQQEFKTGLKKAVSVLNEAIQTNIAQDGETPYDNEDLFNYLKKHMNVIKTDSISSCKQFRANGDGYCTTSSNNQVFYTTDGMRFETSGTGAGLKLHESDILTGSSILLGRTMVGPNVYYNYSKAVCGSYGLTNNPNNTMATPCLVVVDVNGDKKPNSIVVKDYPYSYYKGHTLMEGTAQYAEQYTYPSPSDKKLQDVFTIMITDEKAIPFGVVAQRAMYSK